MWATADGFLNLIEGSEGKSIIIWLALQMFLKFNITKFFCILEVNRDDFDRRMLLKNINVP